MILDKTVNACYNIGDLQKQIDQIIRKGDPVMKKPYRDPCATLYPLSPVDVLTSSSGGDNSPLEAFVPGNEGIWTPKLK